MVTRVLLLARVQFTHGVFLREKRSKAELWASRSVGPRLKTPLLVAGAGLIEYLCLHFGAPPPIGLRLSPPGLGQVRSWRR